MPHGVQGTIDEIQGVLEFTVGGVTSFTGIGAGGGGEARILATRVGIGFGEIAGMARVTAAVPGVLAGTLTIEQSVNGVNWDHVDSFTMTLLSGTQPFAIKIIGRYVRAVFTVPAGEDYSIRFGAMLRPISQP